MKHLPFIVAATLALTSCTSAQIASTETTVSKYQADVAAACSIATTAVGTTAAILDPNVQTAALLVGSACGTEEAVASLVLSPTSVAWLNTLITTLKSNGKVVPPAPIVNP